MISQPFSQNLDPPYPKSLVFGDFVAVGDDAGM